MTEAAETPPHVGWSFQEVGWRLIETFNPEKHRGTYLFADELNIYKGHWYAGETEPRLSYTGQGGDGDFPIWPKYWMPMPLAPGVLKEAKGKPAEEPE